ncbi:hypothetical protein VARIO8X_60447 [Burkholderiales bacterium 8X]|nr:hypothetical protein VARIO8X_60447 [Burkholderiales bacterium 8X]
MEPAEPLELDLSLDALLASKAIRDAMDALYEKVYWKMVVPGLNAAVMAEFGLLQCSSLIKIRQLEALALPVIAKVNRYHPLNSKRARWAQVGLSLIKMLLDVRDDEISERDELAEEDDKGLLQGERAVFLGKYQEDIRKFLGTMGADGDRVAVQANFICKAPYFPNDWDALFEKLKGDTRLGKKKTLAAMQAIYYSINLFTPFTLASAMQRFPPSAAGVLAQCTLFHRAITTGMDLKLLGSELSQNAVEPANWLPLVCYISMPGADKQTTCFPPDLAKYRRGDCESLEIVAEFWILMIQLCREFAGDHCDPDAIGQCCERMLQIAESPGHLKALFLGRSIELNQLTIHLLRELAEHGLGGKFRLRSIFKTFDETRRQFDEMG